MPACSYLSERNPSNVSSDDYLLSASCASLTNTVNRSQAQNYQDCVDKVHKAIMDAIVIPGETSKETKKKVERHMKVFKEKNLTFKKHQAEKRSSRKDF